MSPAPAATLSFEPSESQAAPQPSASQPPAGRPSRRQQARDYYDISKPRILYLLLVVAWSAMFVAANGWPHWKPFLAVTLAGTFSVASAGAFNHVLERHKDAKMARTATRPVASGRLHPRHASFYGALTAIASFACLALPGYWLAGYLTLGAIAYYVLVYTVILKPTTPQNIVIGGLAGSFPAVIGWTAITGSLAVPASLGAFALALIVFLWTPAHFWALALLYKDDYAKAEYPMMPNVRGEASTRRQVVVYSVLTVAVSVAPLALGQAAWLYAVVAGLMGFLLLRRSLAMARQPTAQRYRTFFLFTIQYLFLLLVGLMADRVIPQPALW